MSTVKATVKGGIRATEVLSESTRPGTTNRTEEHDAFDRSVSLSATTTPNVSIIQSALLTGGSGTIDLSAFVTLDGTVNCTGKKIVAIHVNNLSSTDQFALQAGASNGYSLNSTVIRACKGGKGFQTTYFGDDLADVDGTHKTLDWTLAADQSAQLQIVLG